MNGKRAIKKKKPKMITAAEFDAMFDRGEDISPYMDFDKAVVHPGAVRRVNVDFSAWMLKRLDEEAVKLNISRQAVIKMWIYDRLTGFDPGTAARRRG
jgi:hypothetical protein